MPLRRRQRHLIIATTLLLFLLSLLIFGGPLLGKFVFAKLQERVVAELGGHLSVGTFSADLFTGTFRFTDLVYEEEHPDIRSVSIQAKEGNLDISIGSLFSEGGLVIEELRLKEPTLRYQQHKKGNKTAGGPGALRRGVQLKKLSLAAGELFFEDLSGESPVRVHLTQLSVRGRDLSTHEPLQLCSHVNAKALVDAVEPFSLLGSETASEGPEEKIESCRFQGVVLAPLLPYLLEGLPIRATQGKMEGELFVEPTDTSYRLKANLQFRDVRLDLGSGALAFLAQKTGVPKAIESRKGTFSLVILQDVSEEQAHGYVGDFLRLFLAYSWQQAIATLTTTR